MIEFINTWHSHAEFVYFISQICLAAGLILAYRQLKAVKQDSALRIKRTSAEKAIEACERYVNLAVPLTDDFYIACQKKGLNPYKGAIGDFTISSIGNSDLPAARARLNELTSGNLLNQLEMVAAIMVSGVGDEAVAFPVIGGSFCSTIESHYDLLCLCRSKAAPNRFQNMVDLYQIWGARQKKLDLAAEKARLDASMADLPDRKIVPLEQR